MAQLSTPQYNRYDEYDSIVYNTSEIMIVAINGERDKFASLPLT